MPAPHGTLVDLSTIQKQIGMLERYLGRNAMPASQTIATLILSEFTAINTAIQAASINTQLSITPTLSIRWDYTPDPAIANSDGSAGPTNVTITGPEVPSGPNPPI